MAKLNFDNKNEAGLYQVGKDIAKLEAKLEALGKTSSELDVLKVILPAATEEQINSGVFAIANLPDRFKNSIIINPNSYGGYEFMEIMDNTSITFHVEHLVEKEKFIIKIADFKNPKETVHAEIKKAAGGAAASDA